MDSYVLSIAAVGLLFVSFAVSRDKTRAALCKSWKSFEAILPQFLAVLLTVSWLLAVCDAQTISRLIGPESRWIGVVMAAAVGAITLIPGFIAFATAAALVNRKLGTQALVGAGRLAPQMLLLLPPIFVLLGLLDVGIPRATIVKYLGAESGAKGLSIAILLGLCTSGPLYAAFPFAAVFMTKGVAFVNILAFLGAWSTTKIPMLLFEGANLGWRFALARLLVDVPGIVIIAYALRRMVSDDELAHLYAAAARIGDER